MRQPLRNYPRDPRRPLHVVEPGGHPVGAATCRRTWAYYLGDLTAADETVPLATRWLALLARMADGEVAWERPVPGSFYPAGFRSQVLSGCGVDAASDPVSLTDASAAAVDATGPRNRLATWLAGTLDRADSVPTEDLVLVATSLNLLTLYRVVLTRLGDEARRRRDPVLFAELIRAYYAVAPSPDAAAEPFQRILDDAGWAAIHRLGAAIRLIAHYNRSGRDLAASQDAVDRAEALLAAHGDETFGWVLLRSHFDRARALHDWRIGHREQMVAHLDGALRDARHLQDRAGSPAQHLAATHAERLVLEATLKAFLVGHAAAEGLDVARRVERILALDGADPYSNLAAGDAYWVLGRDRDALACFSRAAAAGTLAGALAAHRAASALTLLGRAPEAESWLQAARRLDPEVAA